jgi:hypothetical protein
VSTRSSIGSTIRDTRPARTDRIRQSRHFSRPHAAHRY